MVGGATPQALRLPILPSRKFMSTAINIMAQRKVLPLSTDEEVCFGRFS